MTAHERRLEKKRKLKETFDNDYDMKGDNEYYETWKAEASEQAEVNVVFFISYLLFFRGSFIAYMFYFTH